MCGVNGFIAAGFQPSATNGIYSRRYIVVFANRKKTVLAILGLLSESFSNKMHSPCARRNVCFKVPSFSLRKNVFIFQFNSVARSCKYHCISES